MWLLILTLITDHGAAVTTVSGFKTAKECMQAGADWSSDTMESAPQIPNARALCVQRGR